MDNLKFELERIIVSSTLIAIIKAFNHVFVCELSESHLNYNILFRKEKSKRLLKVSLFDFVAKVISKQLLTFQKALSEKLGYTNADQKTKRLQALLLNSNNEKL